MSRHPVPKRIFTEAEYLGMEDASDEKHELHNGEIFAMGGATSEHNLVASAFVREIGVALKGRRCRVYNSDQRIRVAESGLYTYADASVVCGPARFGDEKRMLLLNPQVIIEVSSDSSESYDRTGKFDLYRALASLGDYVIASASEAQVEHRARQPDGSWLVRELGGGERLRLRGVECEISLDEVYAGVFDDVL